MTIGLLELDGTIDLGQFWPQGLSDADTTKIVVQVGSDAFRFRHAPGQPFIPTHVFDDAVVVGETRKPAVDKGKVTVRLQGIDAPELHYRPKAALKTNAQSALQHKLFLDWNLDFRQYFGETAANALGEFLRKINQNPLPCKVVTAVETPNDVFDTYGRFVGDIITGSGNLAVNVNHWLVENGYAAPTFYASMSRAEIIALTGAYKSARARKRGMWAALYSSQIGAFIWDLVFRGKNAALEPQADLGKLILPKLFRRQSTYEVNKRAKMVKGSFGDYLKQRNDELHLLSEFLEQGPAGAPVHRLDEFVTNKRLKLQPSDLVFRERPSRIRKPGGAPIEW